MLGEYLIASARTGDRAAFDRLARLWQPDLMRHAYRLTGERDVAQDVLQDAWLDIVRGLGSLRDAAAFPAWAYRIVARKSALMIRKRQASRAVRAAVAAEPRMDEPRGGEAEASADLVTIKRAIAQLPEQQRIVISLFHQEDMSVAEVAIAMDIPVGTVKTRLMHARRKIRAALQTPLKGEDDEQ